MAEEKTKEKKVKKKEKYNLMTEVLRVVPTQHKVKKNYGTAADNYKIGYFHNERQENADILSPFEISNHPAGGVVSRSTGHAAAGMGAGTAEV